MTFSQSLEDPTSPEYQMWPRPRSKSSFLVFPHHVVAMLSVIGRQVRKTFFKSLSSPIRASLPKNRSLHRSRRPCKVHQPNSPRIAAPVVMAPTPRSFLPASNWMRSASGHLPLAQTSQVYSKIGRTSVRHKFSPDSSVTP